MIKNIIIITRIQFALITITFIVLFIAIIIFIVVNFLQTLNLFKLHKCCHILRWPILTMH